jgi:hypothetical protein
VTINITNSGNYPAYLFSQSSSFGISSGVFSPNLNTPQSAQICDQTSYSLYLLVQRNCDGTFQWQQVFPSGSMWITTNGQNICLVINSDGTSQFLPTCS